MKVRLAVLILLLGGTLTWFQIEKGKGKFRIAEQTYVDVLVANTRDTLVKSMPAQSPEVVLVEFREEDKAEFAAWPPAPLDYIMVLKRLAAHKPELVGIAEPLRWDDPNTQFIGELRQAMLPFPSFVLGFDLVLAEGTMSDDATAFVAQEMPVLAGSDGDMTKAPVYTRVTRLPDKALRIAAQTGFLTLEGDAAASENSVLFAATNGEKLVPSFAAQVVGLFKRAPYASQRLRFGTGARLSLGDEHVIPLTGRGTMEIEDHPAVARVNALDLMTPEIDDETGREARSVLGTGKVILLSLSSASGATQGVQQAQAIAQALAMPSLRRADSSVDWLAAAGAALLAIWQLGRRRFGALMFGFAVFVGGMAASLLVFQSSLLWWSPLPALAVQVTSTLFCFLWPARRARPPEVDQTPQEAAA